MAAESRRQAALTEWLRDGPKPGDHPEDLARVGAVVVLAARTG